MSLTAASHTLYSLSLFLALAALNLWTARRYKTPLPTYQNLHHGGEGIYHHLSKK